MHLSNYPQSVEQIVDVENDDDGVHLVLLHVVVGVLNKLDVLLLIAVLPVVVKQGLHIVVVRQLGQVELQCKHQDHHEIYCN